MPNPIIPRPEAYEEKIRDMRADGAGRLHVLADFDGTLIKVWHDRKRLPSIISVLRDGSYLTPQYAQQAHALYETHHPILANPSLPAAEKKRSMEEWWRAHYELLRSEGLTREHVQQVATSGKLQLRPGAGDFLARLKAAGIPLVILSSSGLGDDAIRMFLEHEGVYDKHAIRIISNRLQWDKQGKFIGAQEPIIHSLNKDETHLRQFSWYEEVEPRQNVVLIGDDPADVGMVAGFPAKTIVSVGFLDRTTPERERVFLDTYDVQLPMEADFGYANELLKKLM